ncbi:MAG: polyphosphate kinase 1 [Spirochaetales bacterium]|nr:MAG: polyphosphate kinase 1 [Spirochaetales bacterium]
MEFNRRVLDEALDPSLPLLERLKFVCIVSSNFDEFFMVRVATLRRQHEKSDRVTCPSGISPSRQLELIAEKIQGIIRNQHKCLETEIIPGLKEKGFVYVLPTDFDAQQKQFEQTLFQEEIFPSLSPVRVEEEKPFPFTVNLKLHILFRLKDAAKKEAKYAILQIPSSLRRYFWLPGSDGRVFFTFLEDIIIHNADRLFEGYRVDSYILFRVTRDADMSVDEERDEDFIEAMEEILSNRQHSVAIRLEVSSHNPELKNFLKEKLGIDEKFVYTTPGRMDLRNIMSLAFTQDFDQLRYPDWSPRRTSQINRELTMWDNIKRQDIMLHHPYESFEPVLTLLREAAEDPQVLSIKMTLYRTSGQSPIIGSLSKAAKNGKQVTVLLELKARFDEERNIEWANTLQKAGVIVIYGIARLKVHAKATLIVRRETEGVRRYLHLSTGNYNDKTARLYTDIGFMTCREDLTYEAVLFFNAITGYSSAPNLSKLTMAPISLKEKLLKLIRRETERSTADNPGLIMAKMNSLADPDVIRALYQASKAGVRILLNVRGICMLVPGVKDQSKTITVVSVIDRYLEHARVFHFHNKGQEETYLSSADWMPRNLEHRVELMFPVEAPPLKTRLKSILESFFRDNQKSSVLASSGVYVKSMPSGEAQVRGKQENLKEKVQGSSKTKTASKNTADAKRQTVKKEKPFRVQQFFYEQAQHLDPPGWVSPKREFAVRRTPPQD